MRLMFGDMVAPGIIKHRNDACNAWGPAWRAWREGDGFMLEYDSGDVGGHYRRTAIDAVEFAQLRVDPDAFLTIARAHGG